MIRPDPQENIPTIQEWLIELPIGTDLTDDKRAAIERLDDHGFYSIDVTHCGINVYLAFDGEENELHSELAKLFDDFELKLVHDERGM